MIYDLLFRAATETLSTFACDPRHNSDKRSEKSGGTLGITAILHTWTQNLSLHPHLHCVVTGGASGIGRATVGTACAAGAKVIFGDINEEGVAGTAA